ncbi:uncharacterized protein TDEL_0D04740 [Torulaspora delbrueckii]|uniref:FAD/NAD(P)-binding domain-containing protein n=1 Tax=Torulaspora delbrueckii TaxID=4950 RepID=G8ZTW4_TORDE|nr:hypothetical protein TDEL_0D04740 [Torulaspora delbrueckii]CCE92058.1 hypothetical protein TDEL_0D04740 [Torulaspora delbrueckii]
MIRKVAVIGGGPAGLTTVYNSIKVNKDSENSFICVGFEARSKLGGVWSDTPGANLDTFPSTFDQLRFLQDERIAGDPRALFYEGSPLIGANYRQINLGSLTGSSPSKTIKVAKKARLARDGIFFTDKTGLYDNFMSNVPEDLMRYEDDTRDYKKDIAPRNSAISPLVDLPTITTHLKNFILENKLEEHYRLNTSIEYVDKMGPDKWIVVAKKSDPNKDHDDWYLESFDAVVVANGHFQIPYVPYYMSSPGREGNSGIHQFNQKFPGKLVHVRDIDLWYRRELPNYEGKSHHRRIVLVGKSFSCMDVLKRIIHLQKSGSLEIFISTDIPPMPENKANPFYWFDEWLVKTNRVTLKPEILSFTSESNKPTLTFTDGTQIKVVDHVIFATGYLYSYPFMSQVLMEQRKIFVTPDPRNVDHRPSNISRVTGLYLHTFSIAEPTLAFPGVSSNANFQSFHISAKAIVGAFSSFNQLFKKCEPTDYPYYDSIWHQILPSINDQLEWSRKRLAETGNNGSYHFYYPLPLLKEGWERPCEELFPQGQDSKHLFPSDAPKLSKDGITRLKDIFLEVME